VSNIPQLSWPSIVNMFSIGKYFHSSASFDSTKTPSSSGTSMSGHSHTATPPVVSSLVVASPVVSSPVLEVSGGAVVSPVLVLSGGALVPVVCGSGPVSPTLVELDVNDVDVGSDMDVSVALEPMVGSKVVSLVSTVVGIVGIVGMLADVSALALALSAGGSPHAASRDTVNRTRCDRDMALSGDDGLWGREAAQARGAVKRLRPVGP